MKQVSVVMAAHNEAATVAAAVRSIQQQTYAFWELIVMDDASTDTTGAVLAGLAAEDARIRLLRSDRNCGLAAALNRCIEVASGELIARMDADDVSMPLRFEKQVAYFEDHPEVDVLGTGAELVDGDGTVIGAAIRPAAHDELVARLLTETPFVHPTVMARRAFFDRLGGYDESMPRAQDFDLWWRGSSGFRYANLAEPLLRYRVRRFPTARATFHASRAMFLVLKRDRRLIRDGWYVIRPVLAAILARLRLRTVRLR